MKNPTANTNNKQTRTSNFKDGKAEGEKQLTIRNLNVNKKTSMNLGLKPIITVTKILNGKTNKMKLQ